MLMMRKERSLARRRRAPQVADAEIAAAYECAPLCAATEELKTYARSAVVYADARLRCYHARSPAIPAFDGLFYAQRRARFSAHAAADKDVMSAAQERCRAASRCVTS